jgi:hypothetical protein
MSLFSFFGRRLLSGAAARFLVNLLVRRFRLSPAVANMVSVVLMEAIARQAEKGISGSPGSKGTKPPKYGKDFFTGKR